MADTSNQMRKETAKAIGTTYLKRDETLDSWEMPSICVCVCVYTHGLSALLMMLMLYTPPSVPAVLLVSCLSQGSSRCILVKGPKDGRFATTSTTDLRLPLGARFSSSHPVIKAPIADDPRAI